MYFLPQFQNNYQKIGPNCAFTVHCGRKQSGLVGQGTQLIWGSHDKLAQLGQDPDNLELLNTFYSIITSLFLLLHCCTQRVSRFCIYRCTALQLFWDKVTSIRPATGKCSDRKSVTKQASLLNEERVQLSLHFLSFESSSHQSRVLKNYVIQKRSDELACTKLQMHSRAVARRNL